MAAKSDKSMTLNCKKKPPMQDVTMHDDAINMSKVICGFLLINVEQFFRWWNL